MSLSNQEIKRYGRQLVLPEVGKEGQLKLKQASVFIVGMGGLGSPCAMYLATAGVGKIGILDHDVVDVSNIHRQVAHSEHAIGIPKVSSAVTFLKTLNSSIEYKEYYTALDSTNALDILKPYDIIIDCSDNVATRYLVNDACVLLNKPLISGSAIRFEGQLTVYHFNASPCYRCLFPIPPPTETVSNCSDVGVMGPISGILGSFQALEAIKLILHQRTSYAGKMLLMDGFEGKFRCISLRSKQKNCQVCGPNPSITSLIDYAEFCGSGFDDKTKSLQILPPEHRISVIEFHRLHQPFLLDVRPEVQYHICHLPRSKNIPLTQLHHYIDYLKDIEKENNCFYVICRRGNDSQLAILQLQTHGLNCKDIEGGLEAWSELIDPTFPLY